MKLRAELVYTNTDLYIAGTTDDGMPFTAERYSVMAELSNGRRFVLAHAGWNGAIAHWDDESGGYYFEDTRAQAQAKADALIAKIEAAHRVINLAHWCETDPAYGSLAYCGHTAAHEEKERDLENDRLGLGGELARVG